MHTTHFSFIQKYFVEWNPGQKMYVYGEYIIVDNLQGSFFALHPLFRSNKQKND